MAWEWLIGASPVSTTYNDSMNITVVVLNFEGWRSPQLAYLFATVYAGIMLSFTVKGYYVIRLASFSVLTVGIALISSTNEPLWNIILRVSQIGYHIIWASVIIVWAYGIPRRRLLILGTTVLVLFASLYAATHTVNNHVRIRHDDIIAISKLIPEGETPIANISLETYYAAVTGRPIVTPTLSTSGVPEAYKARFLDIICRAGWTTPEPCVSMDAYWIVVGGAAWNELLIQKLDAFADTFGVIAPDDVPSNFELVYEGSHSISLYRERSTTNTE